MSEHAELVSASAEEFDELKEWIRSNLFAFNDPFLGERKSDSLVSVAKVDGEIVGAMSGTTILNWLSVDTVFIDEKHRGKGLGQRLLKHLEAEGKRFGATKAYVDTASFQAEGFYIKQGYVEWGRFRDFAPGIDRIFLRKDAL